MLRNKSGDIAAVVVLTELKIKYKSPLCLRLSRNAVDSETRLRPSKIGLETFLETESNLQYYSTTTLH